MSCGPPSTRRTATLLAVLVAFVLAVVAFPARAASAREAIVDPPTAGRVLPIVAVAAVAAIADPPPAGRVSSIAARKTSTAELTSATRRTFDPLDSSQSLGAFAVPTAAPSIAAAAYAAAHLALRRREGIAANVAFAHRRTRAPPR